MAKHRKITTFCLLLLFMILGSITMMLFLKNKGVEAKRENLKTVKNMIPPKIREEIKEVIDKCDKTIPEIKRKISDVLPAVFWRQCEHCGRPVTGPRNSNSVLGCAARMNTTRKSSSRY